MPHNPLRHQGAAGHEGEHSLKRAFSARRGPVIKSTASGVVVYFQLYVYVSGSRVCFNSTCAFSTLRSLSLLAATSSLNSQLQQLQQPATPAAAAIPPPAPPGGQHPQPAPAGAPTRPQQQPPRPSPAVPAAAARLSLCRLRPHSPQPQPHPHPKARTNRLRLSRAPAPSRKPASLRAGLRRRSRHPILCRYARARPAHAQGTRLPCGASPWRQRARQT